jgi:hypothetical protein
MHVPLPPRVPLPSLSSRPANWNLWDKCNFKERKIDASVTHCTFALTMGRRFSPAHFILCLNRDSPVAKFLHYSHFILLYEKYSYLCNYCSTNFIFFTHFKKTILMRRFSFLFIILGFISFSSALLQAQSREIGAQSVALDDGNGNTVDITIPLMNPGGPYSWVVPITPGGVPLTLPVGTTTNSTLYWDGATWSENLNVLATSAGDVTANSLTVTDGNISSPSSNSGAGTNLIIDAGYGSNALGGGAIQINGGGGTGPGGYVGIVGGNGSSTGGLVYLIGGGGGVYAGGDVHITGGLGGEFAPTYSQGGAVVITGGLSPGTAVGASVQIIGGEGYVGGAVTITGGQGEVSGGGVSIIGGQSGEVAEPGGPILLQTSLNQTPPQTRLQVTNTGLVEIGSSSQFQVDQSGNASTSGTVTIGSGTPITHVISATGSLSFSATAAQSSRDLTITLTGANVGDVVMLGTPNGAVKTNSDYTAWVSSANTVTVRFNNYSSASQTPTASQAFRVAVMQF